MIAIVIYGGAVALAWALSLALSWSMATRRNRSVRALSAELERLSELHIRVCVQLEAERQKVSALSREIDHLHRRIALRVVSGRTG